MSGYQGCSPGKSESGDYARASVPREYQARTQVERCGPRETSEHLCAGFIGAFVPNHLCLRA